MIAIIAILAGMLLPALNKARDRARTASCMSNLKTITLAQNLYTQDFDDWIIISYDNQYFQNSWADLLCSYGAAWDATTKKGTFNCPAEKRKDETGNYIANAYAVAVKDVQNSGLQKLSAIETPSIAVLATDGGCENNYNNRPYFTAFRHGTDDPRTRPFTGVDMTGVTGSANYGFFDGHVQTLNLKFWDSKPRRILDKIGNGVTGVGAFEVEHNAFVYGLKSISLIAL